VAKRLLGLESKYIFRGVVCISEHRNIIACIALLCSNTNNHVITHGAVVLNMSALCLGVGFSGRLQFKASVNI
jgi:hypothetical protein